MAVAVESAGVSYIERTPTCTDGPCGHSSSSDATRQRQTPLPAAIFILSNHTVELMANLMLAAWSICQVSQVANCDEAIHSSHPGRGRYDKR